MPDRNPVPIGTEDFKVLVDKGYFFVDKTLLIKDLLDAGFKSANIPPVLSDRGIFYERTKGHVGY